MVKFDITIDPENVILLANLRIVNGTFMTISYYVQQQFELIETTSENSARQEHVERCELLVRLLLSEEQQFCQHG